MAVPAGVPVEQSISEIDAEIRMEDIRQSPAARLKMEHFHAAIKKNLMDKKLNYEAEHRKEILEGLKHMKRRLPADSGTSLIKKLENLAVNLDCDYQNNGDTFLMKSAHSTNDLTLTILHKNEQAIGAQIYYFGDEFPNDNEITQRINDNEWDELRMMIHSMLKAIPSSATKEMKHKLSRYRLDLERRLVGQWKNGRTATITQINKSSVGWPSPGTSIRPLRVFIYGEPGIEFEMKEKGVKVINPEKGEIPYGELVIVEDNKENFFSFDESKFSFPFVVKLELSSRWLLSSYTVAKLEDVAAKPASILQKTNLIRLMANCQKKDGDIELEGKELGRDIRFSLNGEDNETDVIIDSLLIENPENLETILLILHQQAVFNSSWESIVASCSIKRPPSSHSIQFEMSTLGCNWNIVFAGNGTVYNVRLSPSAKRDWSLNIFSSNTDTELNDLANEIEQAFNKTWSLSKCLALIVTRLGINGYEWKTDNSMDTSLPRSDCSLQYESKVGPAWLRKDIPPLPSPTKHEYRIVLSKGRCPLLRMMREPRRLKPLRVARPRPQLSNPSVPTVPPLRVNRLDAGLPPLQSHPIQTPFNQIENMVKGVDDVSRISGGMDGTSGIYGHNPYSSSAMGGVRMGVPSGASPLVRGNVPTGIQGINQSIPSYALQQQQQPHELMRQQQFMRQQSSSSIGNSGIFDFPDDSRGSSPSSVNDFSPGYGGTTQYQGYAPPQSPLVRGGGTTKPRRARGRKAGNVGDRTPGSSIDSPSPSPFSPDTKRPAKGPGSRGGRGSRGKRGISMDQSMSPFQRSVSEMSNSMSSPLAASVTPLYSQQSFDEGTSDEECDPPPFRSNSSLQSTSSTVIAPSRLSTPNSSFTISSSPLATPPVSQPLPSTHLISVVPSPLVPTTTTTSTPTLFSVLSTPSIAPPTLPPPSTLPSSLPPSYLPPSSLPTSLPSSLSSSLPSSLPSIPSSISSTLPPSIPSSSSSLPPSSNPVFTPALVRRKSSLESVVSSLNANQAINQTKKKVVSATRPNDLFDTGLEDSSPQSSQSNAPVLYAEPKTESPKKEGGEEKIVLKLKKSTKESKKKEKNPEKEKEKEKKKEEKPVKSTEDRDRKRKADSSSKERKDKEAKKSKIDPPLIGDPAPFQMKNFKNFKIPKTKGPGDLSIPSSSSSSIPPLPSPSLVRTPILATPPPSSSFPQSKGGPSPSGSSHAPPYNRPPGGGPMKGPMGSRPDRQPIPNRQVNPSKGILKTPGPPPPSSSQSRFYPPQPERKSSYEPSYSGHDHPRTRQPSGGPYPPSHPSNLHSSRPPSKGIPPHNPSNWIPFGGNRAERPPPNLVEGPPRLIPVNAPNQNNSSNHGPSRASDRPPILDTQPIIEDSPASPDGLQIVDD